MLRWRSDFMQRIDTIDHVRWSVGLLGKARPENQSVTIATRDKLGKASREGVLPGRQPPPCLSVLHLERPQRRWPITSLTEGRPRPRAVGPWLLCTSLASALSLTPRHASRLPRDTDSARPCCRTLSDGACIEPSNVPPSWMGAGRRRRLTGRDGRPARESDVAAKSSRRTALVTKSCTRRDPDGTSGSLDGPAHA